MARGLKAQQTRVCPRRYQGPILHKYAALSDARPSFGDISLAVLWEGWRGAIQSGHGLIEKGQPFERTPPAPAQHGREACRASVLRGR